MLNDCGKRFEFRYILGMKRPPSSYLLMGKTLDEGVSVNLAHKVETGELLPEADVLGLAEAKFDYEQERDPIELDPEEKEEGKNIKDVVGDAKDRSMLMNKEHYASCAPILTPSNVKRSFSINMDKFLRQRATETHEAAEKYETGSYAFKVLHEQAKSLNAIAKGGLDFVGEMDIVETSDIGRVVIRDTKSSKKSPNSKIVHESDQLTAYSVAQQVLDGKLPDAVALDYIVCTDKRKETKYVPLTSDRNGDDVATFLNRFVNAVHALKTGVFVPAKADWWGCDRKYCGYYDVCPYAKKPKLVQIGGRG